MNTVEPRSRRVFLHRSAEVPYVQMQVSAASYLGRLGSCTRDRNHTACHWPRGAVKGAEDIPHYAPKDPGAPPGAFVFGACSHGIGSPFTARWPLTGEARNFA